MVQQVEAIYENGILRPLHPLNLKESEHVQLSVSPKVPDALDDMVDHTLLAYAKARVASLESIPTHEEVRASLSKMKGSMSKTIISERGEY